MADAADNSRPWWRRALAWLGVKLAEHLLAYVVSLVSLALVIGWLSGIGKFFASERKISGWSLGALDMAVLVSGVAALALWVYNRRLKRAMTTVSKQPDSLPTVSRAPFQPIEVDDERLHLRWYIRQRPESWLHYQDVQHTLSPPAVKDILDGPYHAVCLERVTELKASYSSGYTSPILMEVCPNCGAHLFIAPHRNLERTFAFSWNVRAQAIQELQRMHRKGITIEGPRVALERPLYWADMEPVKPGAP
jgi:hypothetical protein